jgi:hypothetical protein
MIILPQLQNDLKFFKIILYQFSIPFCIQDDAEESL